MARQFTPLSFFIMLLIVIGGARAQDSTVQPSPTPIIPTVRIESVAYQAGRDVYQVNLFYTNQTRVGGLLVKLEAADTQTLVSQRNYGPMNNLEIKTDGMTRGQSYVLTVTATDSTGQPLVFENVANAQGPLTIKDQRSFVYERAIETQLGMTFTRSDKPRQLAIGLSITDPQDIEAYQVVLTNQATNLKAGEFEYTGPTNPLVVDLRTIPPGQYRVTINALDGQRALVASSTQDGVDLIFPDPSVFETVGNQPGALIVLGVMIFLIAVVAFFTFSRRGSDDGFRLTRIGFNPRGGSLLNDKEQTLAELDRKQRQRLSQASGAYFVIQETSHRLHGDKLYIGRGPFRIGRDEHAELFLTEGNISRQHAIVEKSRKGYTLRDLNSSYGTYHNGKRMPSNVSVALVHKDQIRVGNLSLQFFEKE